MGMPESFEVALLGPAGYAIAGLLGALFGSFANVCIYRMPPTDEHPKGRSIAYPGSHCSACGASVRWYDNVPILSYLWLRGQCRDCHVEFSPRYLLVEAATAMLFVAVYHFVVVLLAYPADSAGEMLLRLVILWAFMFVMVVITFIDLDHKLILDRITYPAIPAFYGLGMLLPERSWQEGLIGVAVGYGGVRLIADGYYFLTRREGMGYGDGKLLAIIGALFGWQAVVVSLFLGSLLGTVITLVALLVVGRSRLAGRVGGDGEADPALQVKSVNAAQQSEIKEELAPSGEGEEGSKADSEAPEDVDIRHLEIPFGPFLAAAAVAYVFLERWLQVSLSILWGQT